MPPAGLDLLISAFPLRLGLSFRFNWTQLDNFETQVHQIGIRLLPSTEHGGGQHLAIGVAIGKGDQVFRWKQLTLEDQRVFR